MTNHYWKGFAGGAIAAACSLAMLGALSGFQGTSQKFGVVDADRVFAQSELARKLNEQLNAALQTRGAVMNFVMQNKTMKKEDAERFRNLSLKIALTDAEKAELEKIKATTLDAEKKFRELQTKPNPTPEELKQVEEFRNRQAASSDLAAKWDKEFSEEFKNLEQRAVADAREAVRVAINEIGKKAGYTVVYSAQVAPYAANDISNEVLKTLDKKSQ